MRIKTPIGIGISCVVGIIIALLLIHILPEASPQPVVSPDEDMEQPQETAEDDDIQIVTIEAVEIPTITVPQQTHSAADSSVAVTEIPEEPTPEPISKRAIASEKQMVSEDAASDHQEEVESPPSPPVEEAVIEPARMTNSPQRIELGSDELETFIRTQTVDNRAKAFPRIHVTYRNVDMDTQLGFYKARGYGFLAVEMRNGVVTRILGKIDMDKRQLRAVDNKDGVAWNYASVITGSEYRRIAADISGNPDAYLAVAPSYHIANLILGSIDKGINGVIDGDYGSYQSYKAIFTTRGRDVVLTIQIPDRNSFVSHEILLSRSHDH